MTYDLYLQLVAGQPDGYGLLGTFAVPRRGPVEAAGRLMSIPGVATGELTRPLSTLLDNDGHPDDALPEPFAYSVDEINEHSVEGYVVVNVSVWYKRKL